MVPDRLIRPDRIDIGRTHRMDSHGDYGESVVFALQKDGCILCEQRKWGEEMLWSVPGGKVEQADRRSRPSRVAALNREMREELALEPVAFRFIGDIWYGENWVFHAFLVTEWKGRVPETNIETDYPLRWMPVEEIRDNSHMFGLGDLLRRSLLAIPAA